MPIFYKYYFFLFLRNKAFLQLLYKEAIPLIDVWNCTLSTLMHEKESQTGWYLHYIALIYGAKIAYKCDQDVLIIGSK